MSKYVSPADEFVPDENISWDVRHRRAVRKFFKFPSRTKREFADECDINNILRNWVKSGQDPFMSRVGLKQFLDLTSVGDFRSSMDKVANARVLFESLPADVREFFRNDPARFLAGLNDPRSIQVMVDAGLAVPRSRDAADAALREASAGDGAPQAGAATADKPKAQSKASVEA